MGGPSGGGASPLLDVFGTSELLKLVVAKLSSQILLFSLAGMVILVGGVAWRSVRRACRS
jgi:hypothetical protein